MDKGFRAKPCGGGGLSTDCSLSALPTGRTHPFKLSDDGPNPQLALLNLRISPSELSLLPSVEALIVLSPPPHFDVEGQAEAPRSSPGSGEERGYSASGTSGASAAKQGLLGRWLVLAPTTFPTGGLSSPLEHVDSAPAPGGVFGARRQPRRRGVVAARRNPLSCCPEELR